jgi:UDP-N-acetyl-D-glucosamine dehydrogenase
MKIAVIGQGYVGLTLSIAASLNGHNVIGFDVNEILVDDLRKGHTYVPGIKPQTLKEVLESKSYIPTSDFSKVEGSDILILAVPTPLDLDRNPDLTFLINAVHLIAKKFKTEALIINESTSYPGTLRNVIKPILEESNLAKFQYASAPERVDPGNSKWNLENTPRVISGIGEEATTKAINFYKTFCKEVYRVTSPEIAEASKIFENTFRQVNIALANEFAEIAGVLGFSANEAIAAAATKPFGFMPFIPSIGVGGHCIPVDPTYLSYISNKFGVKSKLIDLANETNSNLPKKIAIRIKNELGGSLENKRIQIAGIAYKPDVPDIRESPALRLLKELEFLGAEVSWHDSLVGHYNNEKSSPIDSTVNLGVIVTPHKNIDFSIWTKARTKVIDLSSSSENYGWPKFL